MTRLSSIPYDFVQGILITCSFFFVSSRRVSFRAVFDVYRFKSVGIDEILMAVISWIHEKVKVRTSI